MKTSPKICLIGAGNLGSHLARAWYKKGFLITQVYSRDLQNAQLLSKEVDASPTNALSAIDHNVDFIVIAVKDDAIEEVVSNLGGPNANEKATYLHASGFTSSSVLNRFQNFGVLWPLYSFSKADKVKFKRVPFFITANTDKTVEKIEKLINPLSKKIYRTGDKERAIMHIAAVFANNFSNYMFVIGEALADSKNIGFEVLMPIIKKTIKKLESASPREMQTGPARRNDARVIEEQVKLLSKHPQFQEVYKLISEKILETYKNEN